MTAIHVQFFLELKPKAIPYHGKAYSISHVYQHEKAYSISHIYEQCLRKEVERLVSIGVLEKYSDSEWGSPSFIIPKPNGTIWFLTDLRQVNKCIVWKRFLISKISNIMQKLEDFMWPTALGLNIDSYHIYLDPDT